MTDNPQTTPIPKPGEMGIAVNGDLEDGDGTGIVLNFERVGSELLLWFRLEDKGPVFEVTIPESEATDLRDWFAEKPPIVMKSKPVENRLGDALYEYENPPFTLGGPYKYKGDLHPSFRIDGPDGIVASVFAFDGNIEAALERADTMMAALAHDHATRPVPSAKPKGPKND